ncbi:hypothetical protein HON36_00030 [Candidatus Parcubacteria bacterium]|jgi:cation transport ATPase|nr:hypothetical protein [Candidatus Parcubacteria bacterium]MBT7228926.1 hypothetical protein [Candidatus Parcubacteria bacterium]
MIFKKTTKQDGPGYHIEENEIWVADFGSHELEEELRSELSKLKPKQTINFSWVITSFFLLAFLVVTDLMIRQVGTGLFWPETTMFWTSWLWRIILLIFWFWMAYAQLKWRAEKLFISTVISFVLGVFLSGLIKIFLVKSAWAWLNLLVEPIWMVLIVALVGAFMYKLIFKNK